MPFVAFSVNRSDDCAASATLTTTEAATMMLRVCGWFMLNLLEHMKPNAKRAIYQTMVWTTPSYRSGADQSTPDGLPCAGTLCRASDVVARLRADQNETRERRSRALDGTGCRRRPGP